MTGDHLEWQLTVEPGPEEQEASILLNLRPAQDPKKALRGVVEYNELAWLSPAPKSSAWKGDSRNFAVKEFSEVPHSLGPSVVGCSVAIKIGGDHGLLERRRKAPAYKRAGAQEDRRGLAHAGGS